MHDPYHVIAEPPLSPHGVSTGELEALASALNALRAPVAAVLDDLTVPMVERAFDSLPYRERQDLLDRLGIRMTAPRRAVGAALCRNVLVRLQRDARQRECRHGLSRLTRIVMNELGAVAFGQGDDALLGRWGGPLLRATVIAWSNASVADARTVSWAGEQEWFAWDTAGLDDVLAAARAVVEANPGFGSDALDAERTKSEDATGVVDMDGMDPEEACQALESSLAEAGRAARRVVEAVDDGRPPEDDDLAPLTTLRAVFGGVRAVFTGAGIEEQPLRLAELTQAARARRESLAVRATLLCLSSLRCHADSSVAPAAEAVRTAAGRLLTTAEWGETERRESEALAALAALVRLGQRPEAAGEQLALQKQVVSALPDCAMAAVMAHELILPDADDRDATSTAESDVVKPLDTAGIPDATEAPVDADAGTAAPAVPAMRTPEPATAEIPKAEIPEAEIPEAEIPEAEVPKAEVLEPAGVEAADTASTSAQPSRHEPEDRTSPAPTPQAKPEPDEPARSDRPASADRPTRSGDLTEPPASRASARQALDRLITERRFGLAQHIARAAEHAEAQVTALRLAGAAAGLDSGSGRQARTVTELVRKQGAFAGHDVDGNELVLLPALLRVALVTGDYTAGAQLKALVPRLPDALGAVATAVADRALSGALMIASPLNVIADASETESRMRDLRAQCTGLLAPQRLRFNRATAIAKRWLAPEDGLLGVLLTAVAQDDRDALPAVRAKADRLSGLPVVNAEIDRMDQTYRGPSGKPLQGAGRQDLVHLVERAVNQVKEWCQAVDDVRRGERSDVDRAAKEISSLRQSVLARRGAVLDELGRMTQRPDAVAAGSAMEELFDLLSGAKGLTRKGSWVDPDTALDVELLKVCDTTRERPALGLLLTAVDRSWAEALDERLAHDAFTAARTIVELGDRGELPGPQRELTRTRAEIDRLEDERRTVLRTRHDELVAELRRAQADSAVTDDQDLRLQESLDVVRTRLDDAGPTDLLDVRRELDAVRDSLPEHRREATDRIRARLDALGLDHGKRAQVLRHLDAGELATAADLVYFLEIGEDVPEIEAGECHLTEFFPAVPDGLPRGIDEEIVAMVRSGGRHPTLDVLDYGHLSSDEAALAADALDEWRKVGAAERKDRNNAPVKQQVLAALKLLGYDAKNAVFQGHMSPDRREYHFYEATGVEVNGRAKTPAFGSQIKEQGGALRVLVLWGRPHIEVVRSRAAQDPSGTALLVVHFGVLGREARADLAARSDGLQPLMVVDDAALAYLVARGNRQAGTTTQILLPFSGINPYISEKRGQIGAEMFYGRDVERRSVLDPRGTQVIFGGRGLGKSALLSDAGERFKEQRPGCHQSVYVNLDHENIGKGTALGPEAFWSVLDRVLTQAQVLPDKPKGRKQHKDSKQTRVRDGIKTWLDEDSRRGLLILLDECDQFFEADAPRFEQTKLLKGLGSDNKDRAKVVFAGLHSVQRFSKLASNGPFGHLAQTPTVIGPLAPQHAADLLVEPMRALGFEFASVDLVNRVLGHCSYQPFLLQMFGHRLVEVMHRKRRRRAEGPPYAVEAADVETVESDTALKDRISVAFNDTLALDHRYDVIANVLAYHAHHHGLETRLSDAELREECETYWRAGFRQLDTEGFRAYLSEMVGLGVLAPNNDGQGWHLRGPNALRMIGTSHKVDDRLMRAEQDCELKESIVLESRPELSDGRPAPLTVAQLDDLLGQRANQTRVVLGTPATGIAEVSATLRTIAGRIDGWVLPPVGRPSVFKQQLKCGDPRERRVVISDFTGYDDPKPETCREAVELADTLRPTTPGVTRAAVIVTDASQLALWRALLMGDELPSAVPVVLRRHDRRGLRDWAGRQWTESFATDDRLYDRTGGWPFLIDHAHRLHGELGDADEVLRCLADLLTHRSWVREFVGATGVLADPALAAGYHAVDSGIGDEPADTEAVLTALVCQTDDEEEARWIFACLDALQVFDRQEGQLRLEPVLRQCVRFST
ncbi:hypothetical protein DF268_17150 [Streptomyces sp. V2]|uniref:hypothetical protein n=1 Tax=Streptomyces sp. V2 TaxID=1424099 RepID=UPI000D66DB64|nr:hypothetical protein [Streptomyces sp. V2]PWG12322.1 hypothetical protein DF268_17150 [Streptomyces sp. V2]